MSLQYIKQIITKYKNINSVKQKLESRLKNFNFEGLLRSNKLVFIFLTIGLVALFIDVSQKDRKAPPPKASTQVDTFIPEGFVLVPIEIQNFEALDALLGSYGVVDIYSNKNKKLISGVKLIRAPLNPKQFAVLISEDLSANLMKEEGPYFVMVQNPQAKLKKPNKIKNMKTKIIYEDRL